MHLREVQMENFKSFKGKLTVPFEPGFTGITGPNGSGKSNIGDAILFVLGPNSPRAMRAQNLGDLMFNGGKEGKPSEGAIVSLVFDNADRTMPVESDLVTLTRRLKRSGEDISSYFYVNGRASQKKEFVDLLQHARVSADGYNITLQGDVQHIVKATPMQRREILDDIAGVTAFDKDIAGATNKNADVQANLDRIGIVLDELGRNLSQLEKDREAAQKYKEIQDAVKRLKGLMAHRRRNDLEAQIAGVQSQVEAKLKERAEEEAKLAQLKEKAKAIQIRFAELAAKLQSEGGEELQQLEADIVAARDAATRLEEQANFARLNLQEAQEAAQPIFDELARIDKQLAGDRKAAERAKAEADETHAEHEKTKKEHEAAREIASRSSEGALQINRELAELKSEHESSQTELHETKLEADRLAEKLRATERALADLAAEQANVERDLEETKWQLKEIKEQTGGSGKKRKDAEKRLLELKKGQAEFTRQAEEIEKRIARLRAELGELRAQQEASDRIQGGFGRSVETVLKARESHQIKGIVGTIAELGKVADKYKTALQVAAAGRLNAVIVENDEVAAQCIELLKRSGAGIATFYPLTKMVPGRPRAQALMKVKEAGCLGFALDLVEFNKRYENAFWHVFGDTLVADTMTTGRRMMGGVRIVTLEGELFEPSGAMTGGSRGKANKEEVSFGNADRGRLDELLVEIQQAEEAQDAALSERAKIGQELEALGAELAVEGVQEAGHGDRAKELERRQTALDGRSEALQAETKKLEKESAAITAQIAKTNAAIEKLTTRLEEMEQARQEKSQLLLKGTRKDLKEKIEKLEASVLELSERAHQMDSRRVVAVAQLALVETRRAEVAAQLAERSSAGERSGEDAKRYSKGLTEARTKLEALLKMEKKATGALKGIQEARDKAYSDLKDLEVKENKVQDRIETIFGVMSRFKAELPALEQELGEALMDLKENPVEVKADDEVPPFDDLKRELKNREAQLERLGAVNLRALEEYETQVARKNELTTEVDRLKAQREELLALVAEIQQRKKAALVKVLESINENFTQVYQRISGGGLANMELENPDDPFVGGLIIRAQPPGKKVTRIDALSGGEKSLTSMAFIFAIQMYDPSPFYYLDEVDQNLDAVNSEILARMIKENARYAQFIVVSLRKITLKEASHLYGVTQQTPGQSEIIANFDVDTLRDEDRDAAASGADGEDGPATPPAGPVRKPRTKEKTLQEVVTAIAAEVKP